MRRIKLGSGVSKTVHVDQSEFHFGMAYVLFRGCYIRYFFLKKKWSISVRRMFYFGVVIFGTSLIHFGTAYVLFRGRYVRYFFDE